MKGRDRDFVLYSVLSIQFSFSMSIALSVGEEYPGTGSVFRVSRVCPGSTRCLFTGSVFLTFNVLRGRLSRERHR